MKLLRVVSFVHALAGGKSWIVVIFVKYRPAFTRGASVFLHRGGGAIPGRLAPADQSEKASHDRSTRRL